MAGAISARVSVDTRISSASRGRYVCSSTGEQRMREMASPTSSAPGSHILSLSLSLCGTKRGWNRTRARRAATKMRIRFPAVPLIPRIRGLRRVLLSSMSRTPSCGWRVIAERIVAPTVDFQAATSLVDFFFSGRHSIPRTHMRARELLRSLELHYGELRWPSSSFSFRLLRA